MIQDFIRDVFNDEAIRTLYLEQCSIREQVSKLVRESRKQEIEAWRSHSRKQLASLVEVKGAVERLSHLYSRQNYPTALNLLEPGELVDLAALEFTIDL